MTQKVGIGLVLIFLASSIAFAWIRNQITSTANARRTAATQFLRATDANGEKDAQINDAAKNSPEIVSKMLNQSIAVDPSIISGLQVGETSKAFNVLDVSGPRAGKRLCYACAFARQPVICIQIRNFSNELIRLVNELDSLVDSADSITSESKHAFVVFITDDATSAAKELATIAADQQLKRIPLTICDDIIGPHGYRIAEAAEATVIMWSNNVVSFNAAVSEGDCDSAFVDRVLEQARKHLGQTDEVSAKISGEIEANQAVAVSLDSLQMRIAEHKGKIVVVDLWALWCSHCVAALPQLDELQGRFPNRVHTIALNVDFEDERESDLPALRQRVNEKLEALSIGSERMISAESRARVFEKFGIYGLPATIVFDRNGEVIKTFAGAIDYEIQIVPLIEKQFGRAKK
jgi:thiol-disulfide isomerase/thioredoxin